MSSRAVGQSELTTNIAWFTKSATRGFWCWRAVTIIENEKRARLSRPLFVCRALPTRQSDGSAVNRPRGREHSCNESVRQHGWPQVALPCRQGTATPATLSPESATPSSDAVNASSIRAAPHFHGATLSSIFDTPPFLAHRLPFSPLRSPFLAHRFPLITIRFPFVTLRLPLLQYGSLL